MRENLQNLTEAKYWVYGISEDDFDYSVELVNKMINARTEQFNREKETIYLNSPDVADDIIDDLAHYHYIENQYLWQFCLWRLQGLLEASITYQFINSEKKLFGLQKKILALQKAKYTISQSEVDELLLWSKLRNAFSHAPPEQYRPAPLQKEDIIEYKDFTKQLYLRWLAEEV